jgi:lipoprotein-releasing system ATP-binding protein
MLIVKDLVKQYETPRGPVPVLSGVNLTLDAGEAAAIMGPSGSGKSTLLYILGALEPPTSGGVTLSGRDPFALSEPEAAAFRNREIGFVFQDHCLLPQCTVLENVLVPSLVSGADREPRARELLARVGLADRLDHRPSALSGGEKQRAALARALVGEPKLLLCDEPTGNLDRESAAVVGSLILELARDRETIVVAVTHSAELAAHFPQRFDLIDHKLVHANPHASQA